MKANASLLELDISRCEMKDVGAPFLIEAIEGNQCLATLRYDRNQFSKESGEAIHYALSRPRLPMGQIIDRMEKARCI